VIDLTGKRFGPLVVLGRAKNAVNDGKPQWRCRCELHGKELTIRRANLVRRKGCCQGRGFKHGHNRGPGKISPTYSSWQAMNARCYQPTSPRYSNYGGANPPVTVCDRWRGKNGFVNFLNDLGERKPGTTLGRFGDMGNYEPGSCAWQTWEEQGIEQHKKYFVMKVMKKAA
jgi:hypothetical protein